MGSKIKKNKNIVAISIYKSADIDERKKIMNECLFKIIKNSELINKINK